MIPTRFLPDHRRRRMLATGAGALALVCTSTLAFHTLSGDLVPAEEARGAAPEALGPDVVTLHPVTRVPGRGQSPSLAPGALAPQTTPGSTPATPQPPTGTTPVAPDTFRAFATASALWLDWSLPEEGHLHVVSLARSAAGAGNAGFSTMDSLNQPTYDGPILGTTAYGSSTPVDGEYPGIFTNGLPTAQAWSPSPQPKDRAGVIDSEQDFPLFGRTLAGEAVANTTSDGACPSGVPLSNGHTDTGSVSLFSAFEELGVPLEPMPTTIGTASTDARTSLVRTRNGRAGVMTRSAVDVPGLDLLKGTAQHVRLRFLQPVVLTVRADGTPGTARVSYGTPEPQRPFVAVTTAAGTFTRSWSDGAFRLDQGPIHLTLGAAPTRRALDDGTLATAAADVVRGRIDAPVPSDPSRYLAITHRLRLGHLEARAETPHGGLDCR